MTHAAAPGPSPAPGRPGAGGRAWALLAVVVVLWFGGLGLRALYFPDEGRYAEIPREMRASGDYVTPRLDGYPYFEKPPLQYWLTAGAFALLGENAFAARVVPALAGLAAVLVVLVTVRRIAGRRAGWMAGAMMGGSLGFFLSSQFVTLDMLLTALLTGALCAFLLAQDARASAADRRRRMWVAWALCALAVLTKGLVGLLLPMLAIGAYVVVARDVALLRRLEIPAGMAIVAVITVPWFALVQSRNPGFAEFFFVHEHWQRFTSPVHRRTGSLLYFVPIAIGFLLPWLPALVVSARRRPRPPARGVFSPERFGWCWATAIFVFFSVSSSKLPAYVMPALAGAAVAGGIGLARQGTRAIAITVWTMLGLGVAVAAGALPAADAIRVDLVQDRYEESVGWLLAAAAILMVAAGAALAALRARRRLLALAAIVVGVLAACQAGLVVAWHVDAYFSAKRVLDPVMHGTRPFRPDVPFYTVDFFDQTVPFYLGRTVVPVKEKNEIDWAIAAAPGPYIDDLATFMQRWRDGGDAFAVMRTATYEWLRLGALPMRVLATDGRRVVVARH
ncbi:MAG: glycosyltransferase family 39 protein [Burkholderiales bacterium]